MRFLQMSLRVRQVASSSGVAAANGALLEVTFQDITPGESVSTKYAHIRSVASVCTKLERSADRNNSSTYV